MNRNRTIIYLGIIVVAMAGILISVSMDDHSKITVSAEEVHQRISRGEHFILPAEVEKLNHSLSDGYVFIDLRAPDDFENYHPEGAINIPFPKILNKEYFPVLKDKKRKILYAGTESKAVEVWILLSQTGYENIYVLKGGLPYWLEKVEGRNVFGKTILDEEKPRYDFKKELSGKDSI